MVRYMVADRGFPSSMWGELFRPAANFKKKTPKKVLKRETPFKMLHGEETDLLHLRVIEVRTFVHIKDSWKLDAADWEEKVCGYSKKS